MRRWWLTLLVLAGLTGCFDQKALLQKLVPEGEDRDARHFLELVRDGRMPEARAMLHPTVSPEDIDSGLELLRQLFNRSKWIEVETIGYAKFWSTSLAGTQTTTIRLSYQIRMEKHWAAGNIFFLEDGGGRKISSARFDPVPDSLAVIHAFRFPGKGLLHFAVLLLAIGIPAFSLATLVVCVRTRVRRKWLWILFILLPVGKLSLNWTTGEWNAQWLAFQLLGASALRASLYSPWMIGVSFPLGAALFLLNRQRLTRPPPEPVPPPAQ
jgi:hypothetical protein